MKKIGTLLTFGFLYLMPTFVMAQMTGGGNTGGMTGGGNVGLENPLAGGANTITEFLVVVLNNLVLPIGAVVIVFMLIYSGFLFVTARGNESELETAKRNFLYVVIGTAILLGATAISFAIGETLCQLAPELPTCVEQVGPPAIPLN